uniref:Glutathione peroxidase n=1 Tax=Geotrypetes seraphini TaxID=260995 RepID=A0A6P8QKK7_GEOSA|nr:probable glutathione peroxidase 8 [Geotrypetes seraphini]
MEALSTYPLKCSVPKARVFGVFLSMVLCTALLCLLQLKFFKPEVKDFYSFEVKNIQGEIISLGKFRGKATLVVNVASQCQQTEAQYLALQELYRELGPFHFTVLAFPCNQFGDSEPGSNLQIDSFIRKNYKITFPIFSKIKIFGSEAEPVYKFLTDSTKEMPQWNFWKYLVNPQGKVVKVWRPEDPIENIRGEVANLVRKIILKKKSDL